MFPQILIFLTALLVLYYIVVISLDLYRANTAAQSADLAAETDIDISDEADSFQPIVITREVAKKQTAAQPQAAPAQPSVQEPDKNEADQQKPVEPQTPVETPQPTKPADPEELGRIPDEVIAEKRREREMGEIAKRPDYRPATATDGVRIDDLIMKFENNDSDLAGIVYKCEAA